MADVPEIDRFEDLVPIGRGGQAVVYRALQTSLSRTVALKVFQNPSIDAAVLRRFDVERRAAGGLRHRSIVQLHDAGIHGQLPWISMEYMAGGSAADRLAAAGPFSEAGAAGVMLAVTEALEAAHQAGVLHRDIKPENILFDEADRPHLSDFGIAALLNATRASTQGLVIGTVAHMAPELHQGVRASVASDVYSLGSTLFMLLTGRAAFVADTDESFMAPILRSMSDPVPDLRAQGISDPMSRLIEWCMAKAPDQRPAPAAAVADHLRTSWLVADSPVVAPAPAPVETSPVRVDLPTPPKPERPTDPGAGSPTPVSEQPTMAAPARPWTASGPPSSLPPIEPTGPSVPSGPPSSPPPSDPTGPLVPSGRRPRLLVPVAALTGLALIVALIVAVTRNGAGDVATSRTTAGPSGGTASRSSAPGGCTDKVGCVTVKPGDPVQLGTLLAITGDNSALGLDSQHGAVLGVDYLDGKMDGRMGQIAGHDVKWQNEDDGCSATGGQSGGRNLAANKDIVAVIGTSCSSAALGVADKIMNDAGIPLISPSNTGPALTGTAHQAFYLRTAHNDRIQGAVAADFAQKKGLRTAATINDESPYADGLATTFRNSFKKNGGTITSTEAIKSTETDFTTLLTRLARDKPDLVYLPLFTAACAALVKQARLILPGATLLTADGCLAASALSSLGSAADGLHATSPDLSSFSSKAFYEDQLLPAYKTQFGTEPTSVFHAHAFDAVQILAKAIERTAVKAADGSLVIPRDGLRVALFAISGYQGVSGTLTCVPTGDCATSVTVEVYTAPNWPVAGGNRRAQPVFSEEKRLTDV